jgi:hypothetical protein
MVVNQLNVTGRGAGITWQSLLLENAAPGARSAAQRQQQQLLQCLAWRMQHQVRGEWATSAAAAVAAAACCSCAAAAAAAVVAAPSIGGMQQKQQRCGCCLVWDGQQSAAGIARAVKFCPGYARCKELK